MILRTVFLSLLLAVNAFADKALFEAKCIGCHALPDPLSLNEKQWASVLNTMQQRLREAGRPPLSETELKKIRCYLNGEAGKPCP